MEIEFLSNLDFQLNAIKSTVSIFESQKFKRDTSLLMGEIISNNLNLTTPQILDNIKKIQERNNIDLVKELKGMNFSIEMETGTGKTYVYLKTVFELYQNYGFKKFLVIVPSVAIREGVIKTLQMTQKHFRDIYDKIPYDYYEYDSKKINQIRQFVRSNDIQIMIMTIDSFNKDNNIMNQAQDKLNGEKPIHVISKTNPIMILDEPQNMESDKTKDAISNMKPLFTLRYSATHKDVYNLVYRLSPVNAYNMNLVKKIEVMSVIKNNKFNHLLIKCEKIIAEKKGIRAKLSLNKKTETNYKEKLFVIKIEDDLEQKTNNPEYSGFIVSEIDAKRNFIRFTNGIKIKLGEGEGTDREEIMKNQIRQTVEEHFEKAVRLKKKGIKPLSLFFIDKVDNYVPKDGFIKKTFENSFDKLKKNYPQFKNLKAKDVHKGYFSKRKSDSGMENDKEVFNLIMKDKEKLISFEEPVQFIFSHSALREGWDNPNVFNICTLNQTKSVIKKRQEIGRGMRLPINQEGVRVHGDQNILSVIANEHYANYAKTLQLEYEEEYGYGNSPGILDSSERKTLKLKKGFELNPEFQKLWKKVSKKTKYAVSIDTKHLIKSCVERIDSSVTVSPINIDIITATLSVVGDDSEVKVDTDIVGMGGDKFETQFSIPNIIEHLANDTKLTRNTILYILTKTSKLNQIFLNPQFFISRISDIIKDELKNFLVNGVKYQEIEEWYKMELFEDIITHKEVVSVKHSIYEKLIRESDVEEGFAVSLDKQPNVRLFTKLPDWFKVQTPIGGYNPDWAIMLNDMDEHKRLREKLYLVSETKGAISPRSRSIDENDKIRCARKHFAEIDTKYDVVTSIDDFLKNLKN